MIPPDDFTRSLTHSKPGELEHLGIAGGAYTITLTGAQTNGRYCIIEMFVPPGGGPPPHRHDFEETFVIEEGEIEAVFRGETLVARQGETLHIPANAPHRFQNVSGKPARLTCICAPAGQDEFFREIGIPVATSTGPAPQMSDEERAARGRKARELASKYGVEFV